MQYNISIPQKQFVEYFPTVDLKPAAVMNWIINFTRNNPRIKTIQYDGKLYFWISYQYIIQELPLIYKPDKVNKRTGKAVNQKDTVYRHIRQLVKVGLLEAHPGNSMINKAYYTLGENYLALVSDSFVPVIPYDPTTPPGDMDGAQNEAGTTPGNKPDGGQKDPPPEKNPMGAGKKPDGPPEINPANTGTINPCTIPLKEGEKVNKLSESIESSKLEIKPAVQTDNEKRKKIAAKKEKGTTPAPAAPPPPLFIQRMHLFLKWIDNNPGHLQHVMGETGFDPDKDGNPTDVIKDMFFYEAKEGRAATIARATDMELAARLYYKFSFAKHLKYGNGKTYNRSKKVIAGLNEIEQGKNTNNQTGDLEEKIRSLEQRLQSSLIE